VPYAYAAYDSCWRRTWTPYGPRWVNICNYGYYWCASRLRQCRCHIDLLSPGPGASVPSVRKDPDMVMVATGAWSRKRDPVPVGGDRHLVHV